MPFCRNFKFRLSKQVIDTGNGAMVVYTKITRSEDNLFEYQEMHNEKENCRRKGCDAALLVCAFMMLNNMKPFDLVSVDFNI